VTCDPNSKYRTVDGSCNNLKNPSWGASMTPFYRYINPEFSDGNIIFFEIIKLFSHVIVK